MKSFKIVAKDVRAFEDFIYKFTGEIVDCREGVLLDNTYTYIGNCDLMIKEYAETSNSSGYIIYFAENEDENCKVEAIWEDFTEQYDKDLREEDE